MINPLSVKNYFETTLLRAYGDEGGNDLGNGHGHGHGGGEGGDQGNGHRGEGDNHHRITTHSKQQENHNEHKKDTNKKSVKPSPQTFNGYNFAEEGDEERTAFSFAAVGDFGCSENTKNTITNIAQKKPELVLPLGDLSYQSTADCWFDAMSPLKGKIMITLGFHDVNDGISKMNQYVNSFNLEKQYNSFDYRHVHFVKLASESPFDASSAQYKFVSEDLKKASENKDIDWIIVTTYGPFYTSPSTHHAEKALRDIYHPLFEKYNVNLVLQAHNHNYQRTYPISYDSVGDSSEPIVTYRNTTGYNDHMNGTIFALVGTGGESFYPLVGQEPYVANQFDGKFGFLDIDISNGNPHTKLTGTFYDNKGDEALDQFTIEKEIKNNDVGVQSNSIASQASIVSQNPDSNPDSNRDYLPSCTTCGN